MPERNPLVAVGDTLTQAVPKDMSCMAKFGIQSLGGAVGLTGILEQSMDDGQTWEPLLLTPAAGGAASSALNTATSSSGVVAGCTHVRYRVTALTSGGPVQGRWNITRGI